MESKCPVCESANLAGSVGNYISCPGCQSFMYLDGSTAEQENRQFYDVLARDIASRRKSRIKAFIFRTIQKRDRRLHAEGYLRHREMRAHIESVLRTSGKSCEVGFGEGRMLESLLREGVDIVGVDISENVVSRFRGKHPEYGDRVRVATRWEQPVDTVYCSALLEHLDDPVSFIREISAFQQPGGRIIIDNLPVLNAGESTISVDEDINFWKPCHRIIFSQRGLVEMFERLGFYIERYVLSDLFNYRVLSLHIQKGYPDIVTIRSSCLTDRRLPGVIPFLSLCTGALKAKSMALAGSFIFRKGDPALGKSQS